MVLSELSGYVAERLQNVSDRRVFRLQAKIGARQSDFCETGSNRRLACDESCAASRATLLSIPVGKEHAFFGDAIDVGGAVSHDAFVIRADVDPADVISPDDQNVWFLFCHFVSSFSIFHLVDWFKCTFYFWNGKIIFQSCFISTTSHLRDVASSKEIG